MIHDPILALMLFTALFLTPTINLLLLILFFRAFQFYFSVEKKKKICYFLFLPGFSKFYFLPLPHFTFVNGFTDSILKLSKVYSSNVQM